ncbi:gluconate 2-dehydrogenase subunit 3 family protein, partial [Persicitalea sp.]|uniref:gluconate 2-dehydrogenase subunit 3 family protein n=1 Tax=Persicitalea sp. TaxID=3100273 RepID=UPI003593EEE1
PNLSIPRRQAVQTLLMLIGGTLSLPVQAALLRETAHSNPGRFSAEEQALITELAEQIIPSTTTPGARAAGVGEFISYIIGHCTDTQQQEAFRRGLQQTEALSESAHGKRFALLEGPQKAELMEQLTRQEKAFFITLRELTIVGYFTSEPGATQALEYLAIPGRFEGDIPLNPGQRAWATCL